MNYWLLTPILGDRLNIWRKIGNGQNLGHWTCQHTSGHLKMVCEISMMSWIVILPYAGCRGNFPTQVLDKAPKHILKRTDLLVGIRVPFPQKHVVLADFGSPLGVCLGFRDPGCEKQGEAPMQAENSLWNTLLCTATYLPAYQPRRLTPQRRVRFWLPQHLKQTTSGTAPGRFLMQVVISLDFQAAFCWLCHGAQYAKSREYLHCSSFNLWHHGLFSNLQTFFSKPQRLLALW